MTLCLRFYCSRIARFKSKKPRTNLSGAWLQKPASVKRVAGAAEHVLDLVPDEVFDALPGGAEVFARIKFLRAFREDFADAGGHGHAQVGVNVHLRAAHAAGAFDVGFRHALRVG